MVFYTSSEYYEKLWIKENVQRLVETPELYMIGRCANNDEQLGYIETRVAYLKGLKNGINLSELDQSCENIVLNDTMRFFHDDGPAAALEVGNQWRGVGGISKRKTTLSSPGYKWENYHLKN